MNKLKAITIAILYSIMGGSFTLDSQEVTDSLLINFRSGVSVYEASYSDNSSELDSFVEHIRNVQQNIFYEITKVEFHAASSPDGSPELNRKLTQARMESMRKELQGILHFDSDIIEYNLIQNTWQDALEEIKNDPDLPYRDQVTAIINEGGEDVYRKLKSLRGGRAWQYLARNILPQLRYFKIIVHLEDVALNEILGSPDIEVEIEEEELDYTDLMTLDSSVKPVPFLELPKPELWVPALTLKTNAIGWVLLIPNLAAEYDLNEQFSLTLPIYYSGGYNYFASHTKFRGFTLQPGARYYFDPAHAEEGGLYVGAHFGIGWYNYAFGSEYRIQAHKGTRPSLGGGATVGYAMQFERFPKLGLEFTLGLGVYDSKYDRFYNEDNGAYNKVGVNKVFFGIDNASISLTYKIFNN